MQKLDLNSLIKDLAHYDIHVNIIPCYPRNSVGFYSIYHYDIDLAIDEMIEIIKSN